MENERGGVQTTTPCGMDTAFDKTYTLFFVMFVGNKRRIFCLLAEPSSGVLF